MNKDTVIALAREAKFAAQTQPLHPWGATDADLECFAALVAAQERERCAQICENMGMQGYGTLAIAATIRTKELS